MTARAAALQRLRRPLLQTTAGPSARWNDMRHSRSPISLNIQPHEAGQRLDRYLASALDDISRTGVQQLIASGAVFVNGRPGKASYTLKAGDTVGVSRAVKVQPSNLQPLAYALDIVYEDSDLLVVNKEAGMVVHPAPGHTADTLVNAL